MRVASGASAKISRYELQYYRVHHSQNQGEEQAAYNERGNQHAPLTPPAPSDILWEIIPTANPFTVLLSHHQVLPY